jgi:hypothetical protein
MAKIKLKPEIKKRKTTKPVRTALERKTVFLI